MILDPLPFRRRRDRLPVRSDHDLCLSLCAVAGQEIRRRALLAGLYLLRSRVRRRARSRACRSSATPRSRRWCATMRGRSCRPPACRSPASSIILVNDRRFNAFVDGRRIFINTGALLKAETPNEIIGVLAHETGHLAGGHQQRLREQLARAQTMAIVASLLGVGAMAAGAATDNSALAQVRHGHRRRRRGSGAARPARLPAHRGSRPPTAPR